MKNKKGLVALLIGLLLIALIPAAMAGTGYDSAEKKTCGNGSGQRDVHLGLFDYHLSQYVKSSGKTQDIRPWFRNIVRGTEGVKIFSTLATWKLCSAE